MIANGLFVDNGSCNTIKKIDTKLASVAKAHYEYLAYGVSKCGSDEELYLSDLRDMLIKKRAGHECFLDIPESAIISVINKQIR